MRNRRQNSFLCIMAMACAAAIIGCGTPSIKDSDTVMEIAGQPVVKAEYQMVLKSHVPEVKSRYTTEEANAEDFWEMEGGAGSPIGQVMELAQEDLARKKVVARLAQEAGIGVQADYGSIVEGMGTENTKREGRSASGEVIYGLTSFTPEDYYSYVYTDLESQLLEKLKSSHPVSEEELEAIYQENQGQYTSEIRVQMLVGEMQAQDPETGDGGVQQPDTGNGLPQDPETGDGGVQQPDTGMAAAQQAKASMEEGADIDTLKGQYPQINFYELEMSSLRTEEGKSGAYAQRWMVSSAMEEGQVCEPFLIGRNIMVMRCLKREENVAEPFETIKGVLKSEVQTRLAQEEIEQGIREAEISFQEKTLEQAALEALEGS